MCVWFTTLPPPRLDRAHQDSGQERKKKKTFFILAAKKTNLGSLSLSLADEHKRSTNKAKEARRKKKHGTGARIAGTPFLHAARQRQGHSRSGALTSKPSTRVSILNEYEPSNEQQRTTLLREKQRTAKSTKNKCKKKKTVVVVDWIR